ncbi:MAG: hypothetical protein ACREMY_26240, partial [bacterium]
TRITRRSFSGIDGYSGNVHFQHCSPPSQTCPAFWRKAVLDLVGVPFCGPTRSSPRVERQHPFNCKSFVRMAWLFLLESRRERNESQA